MKFAIINLKNQVYVGNNKWSSDHAEAVRMSFDTAERMKNQLNRRLFFKKNDVMSVPVIWL